LLRAGQSEVNPQIILPLIAGSCLDVAHQNLSAHGELQLRSYAVSVALGSDGADQESVVAIATVVAQQIGGLAIVANEDIQIPIVVQIAHGVTVGRNVLMAAQVGVAGSTVVDDDVMLGGQVGVSGHLTIGRGAIAAAQTGIPNSLEPGAMVAGYPAIDAREWRKASAVFRKLPALKRRIEELEARVAELTGRPRKVEPPSE